ncbi:MAG: DUF4339 domain-containing protein [Chthoniobacteraceae bacterium]
MNQWYYRDPQNRKIGPLSDQEFEERVSDGEVQPTTRVWRSGLADWTTYEALLAHEANCLTMTTGPTESAAPQSSSYSTQIALGTSATNHPPTGSSIGSPSATPHGLPAPVFEQCAGCREQVPSNLFREIGRRRLCGFCLQKREITARRDKLRDAKGVDANWIGKFLVRCALIAGLFVLSRVVLFELKHAGDSPSLLPTVESPSTFQPHSSAPPEIPQTAKPTAPRENVALPPDIDLVPTAGR